MVNYVSQKYCESKFNCGRIKKGLFNEIVKDTSGDVMDGMEDSFFEMSLTP